MVYAFGTEYVFADKKWKDVPGGTVTKRYIYNGVAYVDVEFKRTPGVIYTYYA